MKKKIALLVSSAAIIACMMPVQTASAANVTQCDFTLTAGVEYVHPGDEVTFTLSVNPNGDTLGFTFDLGELPEGFTYVENSITYLDTAKSTLNWTDFNAYTDGRVGFFINDDTTVYAGGKLDLATFKLKAGTAVTDFKIAPNELIANDTTGDEVKGTFTAPIMKVPGLKKVEAKASTCKDKGNSEYYVCECGQADCDRVYKADQTTKTTVAAETLPLAEHKFTSETVDAKYLASAATCTAPAKYFKSCAVCGEKGTDTFESGAKDPKKHGNNTEVRGKLEATETAEGYTGDTYCKDCNELVAKGTVIPKLETSKPDDSSNFVTDSETSSDPGSSSSPALDDSSSSASGDSSSSASGNSSGSASGSSSGSDNSGSNPSTGIALAITPVVLITGAAMVIAKGKKK